MIVIEPGVSSEYELSSLRSSRYAGEEWNDGIANLPADSAIITAATTAELGYGEMVKWVTCREPQGRAIGKTHIDMEVHDVYK
jgi:hypothetical protein